jgi:hypothetical protein
MQTATLQGERLLIVEDEPLIALALQAMLEREARASFSPVRCERRCETPMAPHCPPIAEGEGRIMRMRRCLARLADTGEDTSAGERVVAR